MKKRLKLIKSIIALVCAVTMLVPSVQMDRVFATEDPEVVFADAPGSPAETEEWTEEEFEPSENDQFYTLDGGEETVINTNGLPEGTPVPEVTEEDEPVTEEWEEEPVDEDYMAEIGEDLNAFYDREKEAASGSGVSAYTTRDTGFKDLTVNIRKRAEWVDETDGDAQITLEYESNSGSMTYTPDMNVVLIQDKSGSMDCNYGFSSAKVDYSLSGEPAQSYAYPRQSDEILSETLIEEGSLTDLESEGYAAYMRRLHMPNTYTKRLGATDPMAYDSNTKTYSYVYYTNFFNSPCQIGDEQDEEYGGHYYLLVKKDPVTQIEAWHMASGKALYNIECTDLHHYVKIEPDNMNGYTDRDIAVSLITDGFRVIRVMPGDYYIDENGDRMREEDRNGYKPVYFLDTSQLCEYNGKWILNTCSRKLCQNNDRLAMSQKFMNAMVEKIYKMNPKNQIAYVPFFGDVPVNGVWSNAKGNAAGDDLDESAWLNEVYFTGKEDNFANVKVGSLVNFTTNASDITPEINATFTYNGTNWTRAFTAAQTLIQDIRKSEEVDKKVLVVFLTDGMPQGTEGAPADYTNGAIDGTGPISALKAMNDVTLWTVGVAPAKNDSSNLRDRLNDADSRTGASIAEYTEDMITLTEEIVTQTEETYPRVDIFANNGFYQDTLSRYYDLDTDSIDSRQWTILPSPSSTTEKGVPENVYKSVTGSKPYVYVESTKTVYWYIPVLSNGDYDTSGHRFVFPVKYNYYDTHTDGSDTKRASNSSQKITYYNDRIETIDPYGEVKTAVPYLIFNRQRTSIKVTKVISQPNDSATASRFVVSTTKYTSGVVSDIDGQLTVNIPAGATSGTATIYDLPAPVNTQAEPGVNKQKYYIYEVDSSNRIINTNVMEADLFYNPYIKNEYKSSTIPYSVTSSKSETLENRRNYLKLETVSQAVTFGNTSDLTIIKQIDCSAEDIHWEHGNPIFIIRVMGAYNGKSWTLYHTFEFTREYVDANSFGGKVSMSHTFYDIPLGIYNFHEVQIGRYKLEEITIKADDPSTYRVGTTAAGEFYGKTARVNLSNQPTGIEVTFYNVKEDYRQYNHTAAVKNIINW